MYRLHILYALMKTFEPCPLERLPLIGKALVLLKITEKVDKRNARLVQLVAIACLDSIGCFLWVGELQEEIPVCG